MKILVQAGGIKLKNLAQMEENVFNKIASTISPKYTNIH